MHTGDDVPRVLSTAKMPDVIYEMSRKGLGLAAVTGPRGELLGIITDGDLRRMMQKSRENILDLAAADCLTKNPITLPRSELAAAALRLMEEKKITSVLIVDSERRLEGVLHIHDLWTLQLFSISGSARSFRKSCSQILTRSWATVLCFMNFSFEVIQCQFES